MKNYKLFFSIEYINIFFVKFNVFCTNIYICFIPYYLKYKYTHIFLISNIRRNISINYAIIHFFVIGIKNSIFLL